MTTIAATREMMAADTRADIDGVGSHVAKIYVHGDAIIGGAGDNEGIMRFLEWWPHRENKPLRIPKRLDWSAIVLSEEGLLVYENVSFPDVVREEWAAIGTGAPIALAALDTMHLLKRKPDPRIAVRVACKRDSLTGGDVEHVRLKRRK